ncbi:unnamed protein product [Brachionus calyciflorus]|uniref:Uncharacterized protein n=1 Tax=Brachionus calyciflorus TaxID=104777 RepID=A0A813WKR1_9BILA|nr:unnamed protein product [Brachionus calyciflorus]
MKIISTIVAIFVLFFSFLSISAFNSKREAEDWYKNSVLEKTKNKVVKINDLDEIRVNLFQLAKEYQHNK